MCFFFILKNGLYKFLTPLDLAHLNKHSQCVNYLQINGGTRGDHIVHVASKKIQGWWRRHRPPKMILNPSKEYNTKETPVLEITKRFVQYYQGVVTNFRGKVQPVNNRQCHLVHIFPFSSLWWIWPWMTLLHQTIFS